MFSLSPVAQNVYTAVMNRTCSIAMLQEFIFIQRRLPQDQRSLSDGEISQLVEKISQVVLGQFLSQDAVNDAEGPKPFPKPLFVVPPGVTHAGCFALQRRLKKEASAAQFGIKPRSPRSKSALAIMQTFGCNEPTAGRCNEPTAGRCNEPTAGRCNEPTAGRCNEPTVSAPLQRSVSSPGAL